MFLTLSSIVKESLSVDVESFVRVVEDATHLLRDETGALGNLTVFEKLVKVRPLGEAIVVGDLHGDLNSLNTILKTSNIYQRMAATRDLVLIFLGDYGDRGDYSAEVYYVVLKLKLAFPEQVVLLRGNHEGPKDLLAYPHDLPVQFQNRFKEDGATAYEKVRQLFSYLYTALLVQGHYLLVHGGLPAKITSTKDLACAHVLHPERKFLEDLLWSDPTDMVLGTVSSFRGAGRLFGKDVTEQVLANLDAKILIRGHEPCAEGFKINHDGTVLTLFSRKGAPYFNQNGAYLDLSLLEVFESAKQLVPSIHKF